MATRFLGVLLLLAMLAPTTQAQSRVGTTAASFLTLGAGARGTALGHAYTAIATGPDGLFWNPGGAARPYLGQYAGGAFFSNHQWLADIEYNTAGVVIPVTTSGVLGLSLASLDYGRQDVRTELMPQGTGETFGASDLSIGLTYAQPLTPSFYFGATAKYVRQRIRDMNASTVAFDFGFVLVTDYLNGMQVAASIMNFGGKMQMTGINSELSVDIDEQNRGSSESIPARLRMDRWDLPLSFKFGVAVPFVDLGAARVVALADAHQTNDNNLNSDVGAQFQYSTRSVTFEARLGYKDAFLDNVDSHLSYGAGVDVQVAQIRFGFDFAYVPFDRLNDTQMFDLRVYF